MKRKAYFKSGNNKRKFEKRKNNNKKREKFKSQKISNYNY